MFCGTKNVGTRAIALSTVCQPNNWRDEASRERHHFTLVRCLIIVIVMIISLFHYTASKIKTPGQMFKSLPRPSHPWRGRVQWERFQVGFGCKTLRANPDWKVKIQHQSISSSEYGQKDQANVKVWFHRDDGLDEKDGSIAKEKLLDSSKWESQKLITTKLDLDSLDWLFSLSITSFIKHKIVHGKMIL